MGSLPQESSVTWSCRSSPECHRAAIPVRVSGLLLLSAAELLSQPEDSRPFLSVKVLEFSVLQGCQANKSLRSSPECCRAVIPSWVPQGCQPNLSAAGLPPQPKVLYWVYIYMAAIPTRRRGKMLVYDDLPFSRSLTKGTVGWRGGASVQTAQAGVAAIIITGWYNGRFTGH